MVRGFGKVALGAGLLLAALDVTSARALVVVPADFAELVGEARAIVYGRVSAVQPQLTDDRRHIDTLVFLEAVSYFKGDLGRNVTFRVPGGELGRYRTVIVGAPAFAPGDEVVLFLGARGPSVPYVLGLSQGVFRVVADSASGERRVLPSPLVARGPDVERIVRGDPARRPVSLSQFATQVGRVLGAGQ